MYHYVEATAKLKGRTGRWKAVDLAAVKFVDIFNLYQSAILTLSNPLLPQFIALDVELLRLEVGQSDLTPTEWLATLGTRALPTTQVLPSFDATTVVYSDAWRAGYNIQLADNFAHPSSGLPNSEKEDILLSRGNTNYDTFYKNCLVTVNGLIHQTNKSVHGIYVVNGGVSGRLANDNKVGILSFKNVAELEFIPITEDMIYKVSPEQQYSKVANINLKRSTAGKTALLVLGGYLHILDDIYSQPTDKSIRINFANLPLVARYFDSFKRIDLSSLPLTKSTVSPDQVSLEELHSDESIKAYLKLSNSFVVLVNTPFIYTERHPLELTKLKGKYYSGMKPTLPVFAGLGKMVEYWPVDEKGKYCISCDDSDFNYQWETARLTDRVSVAPWKITTQPVSQAKAYQLEIGIEV